MGGQGSGRKPDPYKALIRQQGTPMSVEGVPITIPNMSGTKKYLNEGHNISTDDLAEGTTNKYSNTDNGTAAGQVLFWDGSTWVHTETSELFWDDTNKRLGIGTTSPSEKLDVQGTGTLIANIKSTSGAAYSIIDRNAATDVAATYFRTGGSNKGGVGLVGDGNYDLSFILGSSFVVGNEKMRITSGGNVGIGITNPGRALTVADTSPQLRLQTSAGYYWDIERNGADGKFNIIDQGDNKRFTIDDATGKVGIWNTSPSYNLDVKGEDTYIRIYSTTADSELGLLFQTEADTWMFGVDGGTAGDPIRIWNGSDLMVMDTSGNETITGTMRANTGFNYNGTAGVTGTYPVYNDGTSGNVTQIVVNGGIITSVTLAP